MTRVAAIDCGTNTIRLLVADLTLTDEALTIEDVTRHGEIVRLGKDVDRMRLTAFVIGAVLGFPVMLIRETRFLPVKVLVIGVIALGSWVPFARVTYSDTTQIKGLVAQVNQRQPEKLPLLRKVVREINETA